jgi:hypothetical protein
MTPSELLNLMESSIIKTGLLKNTKVYGRAEMLELTLDSYWKGVDSNDKPVPVYNLKQAVNPMNGFKSYICDYDANDIRYQVLHNEADFCFTITMNGCTFGIGSANEDGSIMVTHGNMGSSGLGNEYTQAVNGLLGSNSTYLTPEMYVRTSVTEAKKNLTTFGIRIHGTWNFFYQKYEVIGGGQMKLLGLFPLKTNMLMG